MTKMFFLSNLMLLAVLCSACSDDGSGAADEDGSSSSAGGPSDFERRIVAVDECVPTDLVILLDWTGPAFDPASGELLAPLPAGHVEAVANGWAIHTDEAAALRMQYSAAALQDLFARDGFLGFQGFESVECDLSASHSLWRDEAAMFAFVSGDAHLAAMGASHEMHDFAVGAHWVGEVREQAPTWRDGVDGWARTVLAE